MGRLVQINPEGSQVTVARELFALGGLALRNRNAYVSACAICADEVAVAAMPLS